MFPYPATSPYISNPPPMLYSLKLLIMSFHTTQINKPPGCSQIHICSGLEEKESWNDWFGNPVRSKLSAVITIYRCATGLLLNLKKKINGHCFISVACIRFQNKLRYESVTFPNWFTNIKRCFKYEVFIRALTPRPTDMLPKKKRWHNCD